jgi:predicted SAM-dependent methyltransferase
MTIREKIVTTISYLLHPQKRELISFAKNFKSKTGLEIGGPSSIFSIKSPLPVYLFAKGIDGVNFSNKTVWEGQIFEGETYKYFKHKKGLQYISEASDLSKIENEKYDFIISSHCLEHTANPIKTLKEWNRVLVDGGYFVLVLPDKNFTFDKNRPVTSFKHLLQDFKNNIDETDETHFDEVIRLHNINLDKGTTTKEELINRTKNNFLNRCVHHHVFNFELITELLNYTGFTIIKQQWIAPFHLVTIAQKVS